MGTKSLALVSVGLFATTNIDDLFLLVAFFSDIRLSRSHVVLGQIAGVALIVAASLTAALAALAFSPAYVGLLGVAPIFLGVAKLRTLLGHLREVGHPQSEQANVKRGGALGVAAVTVASGGDNIGVYTPYFATQTRDEIAVTIAIFGVLTIFWCFIAQLLVNHRVLGGTIRGIGPIVSPFVLIALGLSILYSSGLGDLIARVAR
jgi:cadmium resistance protein CadD (predicted permease)